MDSNCIIPTPQEIDKLQALTWNTYLEIAGIAWRTGEMCISEAGNPRRYAIHTPTRWIFIVEWCAVGEPFAFAICPTSGTWYLLDGPPARSIIELLAPTCAEDYFSCAE
jgi:hypothetical protein